MMLNRSSIYIRSIGNNVLLNRYSNILNNSFVNRYSFSTASAEVASDSSVLNSNDTTTTTKKTITKKLYKLNPIQPLQFPIEPVTNLRSVTPRGGTDNLPFHFDRTSSGKLPIYSELVRSKRIQETILRKYSGDVNVIIKEIRNIVGEDVVITEREGSISIKGDYSQALLVWLTALGF